ncbi:DUF6082 family protein [Streptomyces sp. NPDC018947]|uniref:DUF6082 family protein n=1 Tax=Streptomyces sp. NPDC018947 TaxID=3365054 RepID=UPI0037A1B345
MATRKNVVGRFGPAAAGMLLATAGMTLARLYARQLEQRMHWELLTRALDDPSLAEVIDTYDKSIPAERRRQFFYANAWYVSLYHLHLAGLLDQEELFGRLREVFHAPVMREYWEASREHRASFNAASPESRIGRMVDGLVRDLDEADSEVWWVVGTPPAV